FPIRTFRSTAGIPAKNTAAVSKVALTEMLVSSDGWDCDAFAVFRSADRLCKIVRGRKNPLLILPSAYNFVQTVRHSKNSKNKASQSRPSELDFIPV
ncbi:MAG: hypothetical protein ACI4HI_08335, partial [Lachnospiraceae bacterium]